jgi:hypothetical protein
MIRNLRMVLLYDGVIPYRLIFSVYVAATRNYKISVVIAEWYSQWFKNKKKSTVTLLQFYEHYVADVRIYAELCVATS